MSFNLRYAVRDLLYSLKQVWAFFACLCLGVALVMTSFGIYQVLSKSLLDDTRILMGGDLEIESSSPLPTDALAWLKQHGDVSLTKELNTMLGTEDDRFQLVELLSVDERYPLYGELRLQPSLELSAATSYIDGHWGVAVDPIVAERLQIQPGDLVQIGKLRMQVRAIVIDQPDRRLSASWRGAPTLLSDGALAESGLIHPASRIEYEYRVKTSVDVQTWKNRFFQAFPDSEWEVRSFHDRSQRIGERLNQIASGLLIIAFSTLFIGGLGVFNSVRDYLRGKLKTMATLSAVGLRPKDLAKIYLMEIGMLAAVSGICGVLIGSVLAVLGLSILSGQLPLDVGIAEMAIAGFSAWIFGMFTAFCFALPAIGRALSVETGKLFRSHGTESKTLSPPWQISCFILTVTLIVLVLALIPDLRFGLIFALIVGGSMMTLERIVRGLHYCASRAEGMAWARRHPSLWLALSNMHRPGSSMRMTLLSLGSALTLLVACSLVVMALLQLIEETVPDEAPAMVLYDLAPDQRAAVSEVLNTYGSTRSVNFAPLVRARVLAINDTAVTDIRFANSDAQEMARDEHKLSYLSANIDGISLVEGSWWPTPDLNEGASEEHYVVMEDREAEEMNLKPGDRLRFGMAGQIIDATLSGIYTQKGLQTRFWFEAILSDGALDAAIRRYVGTVYMDPAEARVAQAELVRIAPNLVTVRTEQILESARELFDKALGGLLVISAFSFVVSMTVLSSVMLAGRTQQVYDSTVLHVLGARYTLIKSALYAEYLLLGAVIALFASLLGSGVALAILEYRLKLDAGNLLWLGPALAYSVSIAIFMLGARYIIQHLKINPAQLLRDTEAR